MYRQSLEAIQLRRIAAALLTLAKVQAGETNGKSVDSLFTQEGAAMQAFDEQNLKHQLESEVGRY